MKAILEFDLTNQDDKKSLDICLKSSDLQGVIWEFTHNAKKRIKQEFENGSSHIDYDVLDGVERCFEYFYKLLEDKNINPNEL